MSKSFLLLFFSFHWNETIRERGFDPRFRFQVRIIFLNLKLRRDVYRQFVNLLQMLIERLLILLIGLWSTILNPDEDAHRKLEYEKKGEDWKKSEIF